MPCCETSPDRQPDAQRKDKLFWISRRLFTPSPLVTRAIKKRPRGLFFNTGCTWSASNLLPPIDQLSPNRLDGWSFRVSLLSGALSGTLISGSGCATGAGISAAVVTGSSFTTTGAITAPVAALADVSTADFFSAASCAVVSVTAGVLTAGLGAGAFLTAAFFTG